MNMIITIQYIHQKNLLISVIIFLLIGKKVIQQELIVILEEILILVPILHFQSTFHLN